jgi:anti-sigma factor RsiW
MITCRELIDGLYEFFSDELWPPKRAEFDLHLARCASCAAYVKSYKQTIDLAKSAYEAPFAVEMPESLVQSILARAPVRATPPKKARDVG